MRVVLGSFHVKNSLGVENDDQLRTKIRRVQYQQKPLFFVIIKHYKVLRLKDTAFKLSC